MYRKIIVGYNDSDGSQDALALASQLAQSTGAQLILTYIFPDDPFPKFAPAEDSEAEKTMARKVGDAADEIGAAAEAFQGSSPAQGLRGPSKSSTETSSSSAPLHDEVSAASSPQDGPCPLLVVPEGARVAQSEAAGAKARGVSGPQGTIAEPRIPSSDADATGTSPRLASRPG